MMFKRLGVTVFKKRDQFKPGLEKFSEVTKGIVSGLL